MYAGDVDGGLSPFEAAELLQEAQLVDIRLDAVTGALGAIVDLRTALTDDALGDTGLLVFWGVRGASWTAAARATDLTAWSIAGSQASVGSDGLTFSLECWPAPGASLRVKAREAAFIGGAVRGLDAAPPDYTVHTRESVTSHMATWSSELLVTSVAMSSRR